MHQDDNFRLIGRSAMVHVGMTFLRVAQSLMRGPDEPLSHTHGAGVALLLRSGTAV